MTTILRRAGAVIAAVVAIFVVAIVSYAAAAVLLGLVPLNAGYRPAASGVDVFLATNGIHAGLILPVSALDVDWRLRLPLATLAAGDGADDHLAFGWGDRGIYIGTATWADLRLSTVLGALTGFDPTVMHVEAARRPGLSARVRRIRLSPENYQRLVAFIADSFRRGDQGPDIVPGAHYGAHDAFFEARGHYSLFMTCNEWTREALAAAGVRVPAWSPFDMALFYQLRQD